jgi:hypothetical protein
MIGGRGGGASGGGAGGSTGSYESRERAPAGEPAPAGASAEGFDDDIPF